MVLDDFPFSAVVGHTVTKQALLILTVEPRLKGLLISSPPGTGKSMLVRTFSSILRRLEQGNDQRWTGGLVKVPLGITEERLIGGLNVEQAVTAQQFECSKGILAQAHRQVLWVDEINLMQESTIHTIAAVLDSGLVRIEREGMSTYHQADFLLVGTYDPAEGEPSRLIQSRVGMLVDSSKGLLLEDRCKVLHRILAFDRKEEGVLESDVDQDRMTARKLEKAGRLLRRVRFPREIFLQLITTSSQLGLEGHRFDSFAMLAARSNAALAGRTVVSQEDVEEAVRLVLLPRVKLFDQEKERGPSSRQEQEDVSTQEATESPPQLEPSSLSNKTSAAGQSSQTEIDMLPGEIPDLVVTVAEARSRPGGPGRRSDAFLNFRGRKFRTSLQSQPRCSIALGATLRSAIPWQALRRGQGQDQFSNQADSTKGKLDSRIIVKAEDLRFNQFRGKTGLLFIFVVDASGSMAANRMAQAKGALARLLQQAYIHRDQVALIQFRGGGAETLLSPTRSVERAKHLVDGLPAGGSTPLAAGLLHALSMARSTRLRSNPEPVLVILTDGRANRLASPVSVGLEARPAVLERELRQVGVVIQREKLSSVVVDTRPSFLSGGEAPALADWMGARYLRLPQADNGILFQAVTLLAQEVRMKKKTS